MKTDRFLQLLDAYGADRSRWPAHEREAAEALARQAPAALQTAMAEAQALDAALAAHVAAPPSRALADRIVRQAGPSALREATGRWWRLLTHWPALAGVGLAGAAAGAVAASVALHAVAPMGGGAEGWGEINVFGGSHLEWSEE